MDPIVRRNIEDGRPVGLVFKYYDIQRDELVNVQAFVAPEDVSVFKKYFEVIKETDYREQKAPNSD